MKSVWLNLPCLRFFFTLSFSLYSHSSKLLPGLFFLYTWRLEAKRWCVRKTEAGRPTRPFYANRGNARANLLYVNVAKLIGKISFSLPFGLFSLVFAIAERFWKIFHSVLKKSVLCKETFRGPFSLRLAKYKTFDSFLTVYILIVLVTPHFVGISWNYCFLKFWFGISFILRFFPPGILFQMIFIIRMIAVLRPYPNGFDISIIKLKPKLFLTIFLNYSNI